MTNTKNTKAPKVSFKDLAARQEKKVIKLLDTDGLETGETMELTMMNPTWTNKLMLIDLKDSGDRGSYVDKLLETVLVNPRLSFKDVNEEIEADKEIHSTEIKIKDSEGEEKVLTATFPDYRVALGISADSQNTLRGFMTDLNEIVLTDENGKHLDMDFWDTLPDDALPDAMQQAVEFLSKGLNYKHFAQITDELDTFLTSKS